MELPFVDDRTLAAARIEPSSGPFLTRVELDRGDADARRILIAFLTPLKWDDVQLFADGVLRRQNCGADLQSFSFPPPDPTTDAMPGPRLVHLFVGADRGIAVSEAAFLQVMSRLLRVLVDGAEQRDDPVIRSSWWQSFVATVRAVEQEAASPAPR